MTNPIEPVTAWAAFNPNGRIIPASVRENEAACQYFIASQFSPNWQNVDVKWQAALDRGWTIRQVEIRVKEEG